MSMAILYLYLYNKTDKLLKLLYFIKNKYMPLLREKE
jgi:hypothetical protein